MTPDPPIALIRTAPEINISLILDIVSGSRYFLPITLNLCQSSLYDILLNFEHLPVFVTGRKRILLVTHEIVMGGFFMHCRTVIFFEYTVKI